MKPFNLDRRNFIRIGAQTLTIPFLESLPLMANASTASGSLKRIIFYTFHNAWYPDLVFPQSTGYTVGAGGVRYIPLNQFTGDVSSIFTAAKYGAIKSKMNVMRGFDVISQAVGGGGHRSLYALAASDERSGGAMKDSIDTVISNSAQFYASNPFRRFLNVLPVTDISGAYNYSFQGGKERSQIRGPKSLFTEYFTEALPGSGGATTAEDTYAAQALGDERNDEQAFRVFAKLPIVVSRPHQDAGALGYRQKDAYNADSSGRNFGNPVYLQQARHTIRNQRVVHRENRHHAEDAYADG